MRRFGLRIVLPALLVLVATIGTVVFALRDMAATVNHVEERLSEEAVEAAVQSTLRRIGDTHSDYAEWDDAVRNLYGDVDYDFVRESFVSSTVDGMFYDTVYLLDENDRDVFGYRKNESVATPAAEAFGPALAAMIAGLPRDGRDYDVRTAVLDTEWGLAFVAVGPIVPFSPGFADRPKRSRMLVLASTFDKAAIARMGEDFVIRGLRLADGPTTGPQLALTDADGRAVGTLTWTPRRLGSQSQERVVVPALIMLCLVALTMLALIAFALRGLREIQRGISQARHAASHDGLTGLPNRAAFIEAVDRTIWRSHGGETIAVVFLDLDGFKTVNDAYGHEAGDELLRRVAAVFCNTCGEHLVARVGGDEFAVLVLGTDVQRAAADLGHLLIGGLAESFNISGRFVSVGTSVGITVAAADARVSSAEELVRRADIAMYQAKERGRNRIFFYEPSIDTNRRTRLEIAADLRKALEAGELTMAYQPVFEASGRRIVCAEALLRWERPGHDPISPGIFVPIAEETGLIDELGAWTLHQACRDALAWPDIAISVNISPAQFRNPGFVAVVGAVLAAAGLPAPRLQVEVTETYFVAHPEEAKRMIDAVRALGVKVALDDFGTGYSSIGYLKSFAFDKLKLDRSMIIGIATDQRAQRLVQATIALADALNLPVTAEGVETEEEATLLRIAGCREIQGFYFGMPMSAADFSARLAKPEPGSTLAASA